MKEIMDILTLQVRKFTFQVMVTGLLMKRRQWSLLKEEFWMWVVELADVLYICKRKDYDVLGIDNSALAIKICK